MVKPRLVIFMRNAEGGVATYIRNFLRYRTVGKFQIKLVLVRDDGEGFEHVNGNFDAEEIDHIYFNSRENSYLFLKRLSGLIKPGDLIWANEERELVMASLFRLDNKLINILHGDSNYYYGNVEKYQGVVNAFICASDWINDKTSLIVNEAKGNSLVRKIFAPVSEVSAVEKRESAIFKIVCIGRVNEEKGMHHLIGICEVLDQMEIPYIVQIIGSGSLLEDIEMKSRSLRGKIFIRGFLDNNEVFEILKDQDVILFPSYSEAVGLSVVEAMKAGVIPVTSDLPSGLPEIVINDETGYRVPIGNEQAFAGRLAYLYNNPEKRKTMRSAGMKLSNELFNPVQQSRLIENYLDEVQNRPFEKKFTNLSYGSRLDNKYLPDKLVLFIRKYITKN